jgi:hypothetical protein
MANKNLIIGGFTNYGNNQLKPWVLSAKEVAGDNDVVLVYGNTTEETLDWLVEQGVIVIPMVQVQNVPIHVLRFLSIHNYLVQHWQKYDYVITTDVKDVYFQKDPFEIFKQPFYQDNNLKLVVASEGLQYKNEPWGNENLYQTYGQYVYEEFKNNEIFNVGTFGGHSEYVKDMVFHIFTNGINRPIPIVDQAVFNVLINTQPFKDVVWYTHDWACELGTVMDPSKIEQFRPNLLFSEPIWKDGEVRIPPMGMRPFPIVHQYDRVPELKKFVQEKYGQEQESEMFIYRTTQ